jgi:amino acid transporter
MSAGPMLALFMFTGWDGSANVNDETYWPRVNPGRAVLLVVVFLVLFYSLCTMAPPGAVSPHALQANAAAPPVHIGHAIGCTWLGRVAAITVARSMIAGTGTGFVAPGRIELGMSSTCALPASMGNLNPPVPQTLPWPPSSLEWRS